jgi:SSS family solute:Na+ symporter
MTLSNLDLVILAIYVLGLLGLAYYISREEKGHNKDTNDYFLAGNTLPWWAIGASLIAANISAEQIIGHRYGHCCLRMDGGYYAVTGR